MKIRYGRCSGVRRIGRIHRIDDDAVRDQKGGECRAGYIAACADREVLRIDVPGAGQAQRRRGGDVRDVGDVHDLGRRLDNAAIAAIRSAGIERARHVYNPVLRIAQQLDRAAAHIDGLSLDDASVVDRCLYQPAGRQRRHDHLSAVRLDQAAILGKRSHRTFVDGDIQQAVARHVERHGISRGQRHGAKSGGNHAFIADLRAQ